MCSCYTDCLASMDVSATAYKKFFILIDFPMLIKLPQLCKWLVFLLKVVNLLGFQLSTGVTDPLQVSVLIAYSSRLFPLCSLEFTVVVCKSQAEYVLTPTMPLQLGGYHSVTQGDSIISVTKDNISFSLQPSSFTCRLLNE